MHVKDVGIGSFFQETAAADLRPFSLKKNIPDYLLFYTGRHAIKFILDELVTNENYSKIWLPKYYCQHVTSWLQQCFNNIHFYSINPFSPEERLNLMQFTDDKDIVILNNFWGIFDYEIPDKAQRPTFIEDHSHGWLSESCLQSKADYCFASLRKTIPIPLGGILWQPRNGKNSFKINANADKLFYEHWENIAEAMSLKKAYADGHEGVDAKGRYLKMIEDSENYLHQQYEVVPLKDKHAAHITTFLNKDYDFYKRQNIRPCLENINASSVFKIITPPKGNSCFGLHLLFNDRNVFEQLKAHLIAHHIYPSELWPNNEVRSGWSYLLNVHIDYRYTLSDMEYIVKCINEWGNAQ